MINSFTKFMSRALSHVLFYNIKSISKLWLLSGASFKVPNLMLMASWSLTWLKLTLFYIIFLLIWWFLYSKQHISYILQGVPKNLHHFSFWHKWIKISSILKILDIFENLAEFTVLICPKTLRLSNKKLRYLHFKISASFDESRKGYINRYILIFIISSTECY